ncbi:MAG: methyltransferase [Actinomycetota bacterium]
MEHHGHRPMMSEGRAAMLWEWHRRAAAGLAELGRHTTNYLGLYLVILEDVFPPTPTSDLLGSAVLDEAGPGYQVLDMGTGSGSNALLAARTASDVIGVDINPAAVAAATANAVRNGLADRARFVFGDLFEPVDGRFDLIIYDPPFRWFRPRSALEQAVADEGIPVADPVHCRSRRPTVRRWSAPSVLRNDRRHRLSPPAPGRRRP